MDFVAGNSTISLLNTWFVHATHIPGWRCIFPAMAGLHLTQPRLLLRCHVQVGTELLYTSMHLPHSGASGSSTMTSVISARLASRSREIPSIGFGKFKIGHAAVTKNYWRARGARKKLCPILPCFGE